MNAEKDWLQQLAGATSYGDLQSIFSRMSVESKLTTDPDALAAHIDDAIGRIEAERARDQTQLDQLTSEYDAFKQQQSGVVGWLKRKLPFTEARSQELEHRDALNDQVAEILADNFVIARAQMLKEKIASPALRRLGQRTPYWKDQFLQFESVEKMREYGSVLRQLGGELAAAKLFVNAVSADIAGFAKAKFTSKDDQQRKNSDLNAANEEFQSISNELLEKENLKSVALFTLKGLLIKELSERDSDFRNIQQRFELLNRLLADQPKMIERTEAHLANLKAYSEVQEELETLPDRREKIISRQNALKQSLRSAKDRQARAEAELDEPDRLYQSSLRESQEASACLSASQPLYDAYLAEQDKTPLAGPEVTSDEQFMQTTPGVVLEYRRLEKAAQVASELLKSRTQAFQSAKDAYDVAAQNAKALQDESDVLSLELRKLLDCEAELQQRIQQAKRNNESTQRELTTVAESYLEQLSRAEWADGLRESTRRLMDFLQSLNTSGRRQSSVARDRAFSLPGTSDGGNQYRIQIDSLEKLILRLRADQQSCQKESSALSIQRKEALQRRAQMLFDQTVYSEIDFT